MEKIIRHDINGDSYLEVEMSERDDFWVVERINLPIIKDIKCNGIWEEDSIFYSGNTEIRIPTKMLLEIIKETLRITLTDWFKRDSPLRKSIMKIFK
jgi:hypothetical protein